MTDDRPEINIKPWNALQKELGRGNKRVKWMDRKPYAYWKGNPDVAATRQELVKCNVSREHEWNARIYKQVLCLSYVTLKFLILREIIIAHSLLSSHKLPSLLVDDHFSVKQF